MTVCLAKSLPSGVAFGKLLFVFLWYLYRPLSCLPFLELRLLNSDYPYGILKLFFIIFWQLQPINLMQASNICFVRCNIVEIEVKKCWATRNMGTTVFDAGGVAISSNYKSDIHCRTKSRTAVFYMTLTVYPVYNHLLVCRLIMDDNVRFHCTLTRQRSRETSCHLHTLTVYHCHLICIQWYIHKFQSTR